MSTATRLVTGSSRGIGLELVKQLAASSYNLVIATCRSPEKATVLQELKSAAKGKLHIVPLVVDDPTSVHESAKIVEDILGSKGLDYLCNNAGVFLGKLGDNAFQFEYSDFLKSLEVNVAAPALVAQVYLPLILKSQRKTIVNVSTMMASIGSGTGAARAAYSVAKTALNMLTYKQANANPKLTVISIDPGWLDYLFAYIDTGGPSAPLKPEQSVAGIIKTVTSLTPKDSGRFLRYSGHPLPW